MVADVVQGTQGINRRTSRPAQTRCSAAAAGTTKPLPYRVGHGWDLHRLEDGKRLVMGGIDVPHTKGTIAHSDGDVVLHTITDAILGALCQPDIGQLFPDKDPKWKGAASDVFLLEAVRLMEGKGYSLGNIDITVIAERPKISPHKQKILDNLYALLKSPADTINLKAKTSEGVDALGENRAIACEAVVMLIHRDSL